MSHEASSTEMLAITIKKVCLWRREIDASPPALAAALQSLADAGIRLRAFMRYRHFRDKQRAVVEVHPHESENEDRCVSALRDAGFRISNISTLLIEGDDAPGVEYAIARIVAEQDLDVVFSVTQAVTGKWGALLGFVSAADAERAAQALLLLRIEIPTHT